MKQYLLLLRSSDFNKSGNIWTSNPINLYSNSQYKNYSYSRSAYGLNLIGDRTFVGTEVTSPAFRGAHSTPYTPRTIYKTNVGEVIYEQATPSVKRFVDTSSRIDILTYKHTFTNLPGDAVPSFFLTVYESDVSTGPWLRSSISGDTNIVFIKNSKPYIKLELEINSEGVDLNSIGLLFYLEVAIYDPVSPVMSTSVQNILKRFPTWTALFEDSLNTATPSLSVPESQGGKFLTAILQESLDDFARDVDLNDINSFIGSADENQIAWLYVSYNVPQNITSVIGDSIELARVSTFADLLAGKTTDYSFFYSPRTKEFFTLRSFSALQINTVLYKQEAINIFNDFDEFGAKVSLPRLYLESNSNYKKRILDVSQNLPGVSMEAFKRTLRRELDIWRAYGATPNSNFLGATPDVVEIYDIERSTPYFTEAGVPNDVFRRFVENLNVKYPSNLGYVRWDDGYWDYAGTKGEGVSRVPAVYDASTPLGNLYQAGVGDFDDAKMILRPLQAATVSFTGNVKVSGFKVATAATDVNAPVTLDYNWFFSYLATTSNYAATTQAVALVYEIFMKPHGSIATPSSYYANLNYTNRNDFNVGNYFLSTSLASPEYKFVRVFDNEGMSLAEIEFRHRVYGDRYYNSANPAAPNNINIKDAASVNVRFGQTYSTGSGYSNLSPGNFRFAYTTNPTIWYNGTLGAAVVQATPNTNRLYSNFLVGSNVYSTTSTLFYSDVYSGTMSLNTPNFIDSRGVTSTDIKVSDLLKTSLFKHASATPKALYIAPATPRGLTRFGETTTFETGGGYAVNDADDTTYIVPAQSNINFRAYNASGVAIGAATPLIGSTVNYVDAGVDFIRFSTQTNSYYPFKQNQYTYFEAVSTPNTFSGFIDETGRVFKNQTEYQNSFKLEDKFLETISLRRQSFGLDNTSNYVVDYISINATPNIVNATVTDRDQMLSNLNAAFAAKTATTADIYAEKDEVRESQYIAGINTGWIYIKEGEQYIYAEPETYSPATGRYFSFTLPNSPRKDAPIIAKVGNTEYRYLVFEDAATPGVPTFWNVETVQGTSGKSLFLAYKDISNARVKDTYTGKTLFSNLSSSTNVLTPFSAATPAVRDRDYEVIYYVNNAFYVDNDVYNPSTDDYESKIYFSSTPSVGSSYSVIYEKSRKLDFIDSELKLSQADLPLDEGFIYISQDDFAFSTVDAKLSPASISDSTNDLMYLTVVSYDNKGNLKPGQTFKITGTNVTSENLYITTNQNGFAKTIVRYSGSVPATTTSGIVTVEGIGSATPNGGGNSSSQGYKKNVPFEITRNVAFDLKVKAVPMKMHVNADGTTKITLVGRIYWKDRPLEKVINIGWNKARTLYSLFGGALSNATTTDNKGNFTIEGSITAENSSNPGSWFARIEITDSAATIAALLAADGEVVSASDITITGDIVYWNEKYDNVNYANEELPLPETFLFLKQDNSQLISTPNFTYSHANGQDIIRYSSAPNWTPPKWVPLRRFDQYEMGLFGSTPNTIATYTNLHPDSGEE